MNSLNKLVLGGALVLGISGCGGSDLESRTNSIEKNFTKTYHSNGEEVIADYSETEAVVDLEGDGQADFMINRKNKIVCMREGLDIKEYHHFGDKYSSDKETEIVSKSYQNEFDNLLNQENQEINLEDLYKREEPEDNKVTGHTKGKKSYEPRGEIKEVKVMSLDSEMDMRGPFVVVNFDGDKQGTADFIGRLYSNRDGFEITFVRKGYDLQEFLDFVKESRGSNESPLISTRKTQVMYDALQEEADSILANDGRRPKSKPSNEFVYKL